APSLRIPVETETKIVLESDARLLRVWPQVAIGEREIENLVALGHRRVGREDRVRSDDLDRLLEREAFVAKLANAPEREESHVPLVEVPRAWPHAEHAQELEPPDSRDHLLLDAILARAPVEPMRQPTIAGGVLRDVGIEEEDGDSPRKNAPDAKRHGAPGELDLDAERLSALGMAHLFDRELPVVDGRIDDALVSRSVDLLAKVALPIEEADRDERHAEIARALDVISREKAESARVDRKRLVKPIFHREV